MQKLIINYASREKRYALVGEKAVVKIIINQPEQSSLVGNIYLGIVNKVLPGMSAVFIDIGEEKNAFLPLNKLASFVASNDANKEAKNVSAFVRQGERILVQVEKDASETKGPRVTGILEFSGTHLVYMPEGRYCAVSKKIEDALQRERIKELGSNLKEKNEGLIFRTSAENLSEAEIKEELDSLRDQFKQISMTASGVNKAALLTKKDTFMEMILDDISKMKSGEIIADDLNFKHELEQRLKGHLGDFHTFFYNGKENIFSAHRIEHEIDKALKRVVWLENGAYLIFDEAEALTVIDVNTGKFSGKTQLRDTVFKTNLMAAEEIVRQLRLRDIGGIVLVDFIDMKEERDRLAVLGKVKEALAKDEKQTKLVGFTPLGILQLTRKKTRASLSEALTEKCSCCEGTGRMLSAESIVFRLERELWEHRFSDYEAVLIETTDEVRKLFAGAGQEHQFLLEEKLGLKLYFSIQPSCHSYYILKQFGTNSEIGQKAEEFY